ncbi:hypothetical protein [Pedobacter agri]|uniref:hypothetical protein n=1 Tax=Pedobacter agri TaxID=454586 RepID=UPI00292D347A|nr:hypothetical protein [Pedobacter agri]
MKKLGLIIPLLITFQLLNFDSVFADTPIRGCRLGMRIWYTVDTKYHSGEPFFLNDLDENGTDDGFNFLSGRCRSGISSSCTIINKSDGTIFISPTYGSVGELSDFSLDNCPIDDYIPLLIIFTAGVAFTQIRKKQALV